MQGTPLLVSPELKIARRDKEEVLLMYIPGNCAFPVVQYRQISIKQSSFFIIYEPLGLYGYTNIQNKKHV